MLNVSYCRDAVYCFVENSDCLWCCHQAIKRWQKKTDALTRIGPYPNRKLPQWRARATTILPTSKTKAANSANVLKSFAGTGSLGAGGPPRFAP